MRYYQNGILTEEIKETEKKKTIQTVVFLKHHPYQMGIRLIRVITL